MKKIVVTAVLALLSVLVYGQNYKVYSVTGKVTANGKNVTAQQAVTSKTVLDIAKGSKIILFDESNSKLATLKGAGKGSVGELVKKAGNSEKKISGSYLAFVTEKMVSGGKKGSTYMQSAGTAYRTGDDLLNDSIQTDSLCVDSLKQNKCNCCKNHN